MNDDTGPSPHDTLRDRDLDRVALKRTDPIVRGRGVMAEHGGGTAAEQRGDPAALERKLWPSKRVHAEVNAVQATHFETVLDRIGPVSEVEDLHAGDNSQLLCRDLRARPTQRLRVF